ncbi:MAG: methyltransferase family protein, partial [Gemmataceae bacterium]
MPDLTPANPAIVLDLLEAFRRSKTMFAAHELGIFDALQAAPQSDATLAERLQLNLDALTRLLDACIGLGLLQKTNGVYSNTPTAAEYLTSSSPRRFGGYVTYSNRVMWNLWGNLEGAIREGTHRWKEAYGW